MAYDRQSVYITWLFTVSGTPEVAATGIHLAGPNPGWNAAAAAQAALTNTALDNLHIAMRDLMATADLGWADYSNLIGLKVAALDTDGHYLTDATVHEPSTNTGTDPNVIPQATVVISLWSGSSFGRGNYGRLYLPHCRPALENERPWMTTAAQTAIVTAAAGFIGDVNGVFDSVGQANVGVQIMSREGVGSSKVPSVVRVGRVVDTQRRRRNDLDEAYVQAAV